MIEVVSKGYEAKDLEIGPPFYLAQGVKDVIVFDPTSLLVLDARREKTIRLTSPQSQPRVRLRSHGLATAPGVTSLGTGGRFLLLMVTERVRPAAAFGGAGGC